MDTERERDNLVRVRVSGCVGGLTGGSTRQTSGLVDRTTAKRDWYLYPKDRKRVRAKNPVLYPEP